MKNYNKKWKIVIDSNLVDKIVNSFILEEQEKLIFLKYIAYLTKKEKIQLCSLV